MTPAERLDRARRDLRQIQEELVTALKGNNSRSRAPFVKMLHEVRSMMQPGFPYASQAGQDRVVDLALGGKRGGTFVDIGAYDGITGSNSLYFEKWRGWTGVLVEPVAAVREKGKGLRDSPYLPYAVAREKGEAEFIAVTEGYRQMSGLRATYDAGLLERVRADPRHAEETLTVETRTIAGILDEAGISDPDFISLDIEGGEMAALEAFDFKSHRVSAWSIENNAGTPHIAEMMRDHGYRLVEFCGPDEVYVHDEISSKAS